MPEISSEWGGRFGGGPQTSEWDLRLLNGGPSLNGTLDFSMRS